MGYNLNCGDGLNFGKGRNIPLQSFVPNGKPANYYDRTHRGLGYVTQPPKLESEFDESLPSQLSNSSNWDFDISMGVVFKKLIANITSISQAEQDEDVEPFDTTPWAQQLDLQWEKHFEQRDPPMEDKVIQIDVGDQTHPSPSL